MIERLVMTVESDEETISLKGSTQSTQTLEKIRLNKDAFYQYIGRI